MNKTRMIITAATITMATVFAAPTATAEPASAVTAFPGLGNGISDVIDDIIDAVPGCEDMHWEPCPIPAPPDDMHW
jgi:hypothetical protein